MGLFFKFCSFGLNFTVTVLSCLAKTAIEKGLGGVGAASARRDVGRHRHPTSVSSFLAHHGGAACGLSIRGRCATCRRRSRGDISKRVHSLPARISMPTQHSCRVDGLAASSITDVLPSSDAALPLPVRFMDPFFDLGAALMGATTFTGQESIEFRSACGTEVFCEIESYVANC
jgi:hypothetical protein